MKSALFLLCSCFSFSVFALTPTLSQETPFTWAPALKQALGTSYDRQSHVWFTVAENVLTEVFYPRVDRPQLADLEFIVTDGTGLFSDQRTQTVSQVQFVDEGMAVEISGQDKGGNYSYQEYIVTDSSSPVVRMSFRFQWKKPGLRLFVVWRPAINNQGSQNLGAVDLTQSLMSASDAAHTVEMNLLSSLPWKALSTGTMGISDGLSDLMAHFQLTQISNAVGPGHILLSGEVKVPDNSVGAETGLDLALSFGETPDESLNSGELSLQKSFDDVRHEYESGWKSYLDSLDKPAFMQTNSFARRSAQIIKMHEDKLNPGAIVAGMSKPAIPPPQNISAGQKVDDEHAWDGTGGYDLVWPRDLYHAAMGLLAAGDTQTPLNTLKFYEARQRADGSWAQNFWIDGTPYWTGLQMDECSVPILLAAQLAKRNLIKLGANEITMIKKAANYLVQNGPMTPEERWEETSGYSPSTTAAEIAALKQASILTGDPSFADTAAKWQTQIENWMVVKSSSLGNDYYIRISPTGNPNTPEKLQIANGGPLTLASLILDGGFLELVRLGVKPAQDPSILNTLKLYENTSLLDIAGTDTRTGAQTYRRYNEDGYGPISDMSQPNQHPGGYWPVLAGERGHFAVAQGDFARAQAQLTLMELGSTETGLIPEQNIRVPVKAEAQNIGLGVATPLVWAHAEDILLHRSLEEKAIFDQPTADFKPAQ